MKDGIGKVIAATAAASMVCEVPLPAMAGELVFAEQVEPSTPEEVAVEEALRNLPQDLVNEAYLPETGDAAASQTHRRPEREYPL